MSEYDTETEPTDTATEPPLPDVSPCYEAYIERNDHVPDSCTIYSSLSAHAPRKQWIRAWGDAFVSREETR